MYNQFSLIDLSSIAFSSFARASAKAEATRCSHGAVELKVNSVLIDHLMLMK